MNGTKCPVCGHTGKSRVFQLPKIQVPAYAFSVLGYDARSRTQSRQAAANARGLEAFVRLIRKRLYPATAVDFPHDGEARHLVAFVGDAPIGIVRWRILVENDVTCACIEFLGVVEQKRGQGYGKQFVQRIVEDVSMTLQAMMSPVSKIVADIPAQDADAAVKVFAANGFAIQQQPVMRDNQPYVRVYRSPL
ncbi:TPA: hypothetical protein N0F65_007727 [Lagenidium giganteum]|uniref:N-acetyltransferase domain-containing protein n=1 Tax=Lagenidium giganteum TaxID=4803 RepID=A0AAV2YZT3_9STRA|nr:TPA: hypothetical protein N0F65_007727 [Lagenidium giganteum]